MKVGDSAYLVTDQLKTGVGIPAMICAVQDSAVEVAIEETNGTRVLQVQAWDLLPSNLFTHSVLNAVIIPFRAAMVGSLKEDHLRSLLNESGEMRRWKEAERETPEGFEVLYPPPPLDAEALRRLPEAASRLEQFDDTSSLEEL
jgi:hypothetical protein